MDKTTILISAPSLDVTRNVSGVSSVVLQIRRVLAGDINLEHLRVGADGSGSMIKRRLGSIMTSLRAAATILAGRYDVFHSNTAMNPRSIIRDSVLIAMSRLRGKPVFLHLHGGTYIHDPAPPVLNKVIGWMLGASARIAVLSEIEKQRLTAAYPRHADRILVIYNGVDLPSRTRVARDPSQPVEVAFVGRLVEEKGLRVCLAAIEALRHDPALRFRFYGDGPLRQEVVDSARLDPRVTYNGVLSGSDMRQALLRTDALLLPSLAGEGMPMAVLEAMAAGVVPIATPVSSVPEVITDGETGILVSAGSAQNLAAAVRVIASDPVLLTRMSAAASETARTRFSADVNYRQLLDIYAAITSSARLQIHRSQRR